MPLNSTDTYQQGCVVEVFLKLLGVERGTHDHHLKALAVGKHLRTTTHHIHITDEKDNTIQTQGYQC